MHHVASTLPGMILNSKVENKIQLRLDFYNFSTTTPTNTQDIVMSKLDKRRKGVYGPPLGKKFVVFVDDINMPSKDEVDSQPPIELMRQLLDHQTWYDNKELFPMRLIEMQVIGAMRPPDGSSKAMSGRFIRHFNTINIDLFQDHTITTIFSRIVLWHLDTKGFAKEFDPCIDQVSFLNNLFFFLNDNNFVYFS